MVFPWIFGSGSWRGSRSAIRGEMRRALWGERQLRGEAAGAGARHRLAAPGGGKLAAHRDFLIACVQARPDITMPELAADLLRARGVQVSPARCRGCSADG